MSRPVTLTQKQYDFCHAYIKNGFNAYQAAITAGYSESFAHSKSMTLLNHPKIKPRIAKAFDKADNQITITWEWKLNKLKRIILDIIPDDETQPIKYTHVKEALRAMAELNKMQGDYAPDKRLSVTVDATQEKLLEARKIYKEF